MNACEALRPSIPWVLKLALGLWLGSACSYACAHVLSYSRCLVFAAVGFLGSLVLLAGSSFLIEGSCLHWSGEVPRKLRSGLRCFMLGLMLGVLCGFSGGAINHAKQIAVTGDDEGGIVSFRLLEDARSSLTGSKCWASAFFEDGTRCKVLLNFEAMVDLSFGDGISASCLIVVPSNTFSEYCWENGAVAVAYVDDYVRESHKGLVSALTLLRGTAVERFSDFAGNEGALLAAMVCNDRRMLDECAVYDDYRVTGLAHIVAVSGSHLVIVGSLLALCMNALRAPRALTVALQGLFMLAYLLFTAAPVSAMRAVAVSVCGLSSYFVRRRKAPLNALGACLIAMVAMEPSSSLSASLILSAGSSLGILLIGPLVRSWFEDAAFLPAFAAEALSMTISSSAATLLYSAALFAQLPLISPLANVVAAPLFASVCCAGLVSALSANVAIFVPGAEALAELCLEAAVLVAKLMNEAVGFCAAVPFACVPANVSVPAALALSVLLVYAAWRFWPRIRWRSSLLAGCVLIAVALSFGLGAFNQGCRVVMLDVGQGDAILVQSGSRRVLVDTGTNDSMLIRALARQGVFSLDAVIITHADDDHCGSLLALRGVVRVEAVLFAADALDCPCSSCETAVSDAIALVGWERIAGLQLGDTLVLPNTALKVVWPGFYQEEGGNADSVCLLASFDLDGDGMANWTALLTGDAECDQLDSMANQGSIGRVDVLKVGHHGSKRALDESLAQLLSPSVALVSVGEGNRYGHPSPEVVSLLQEQGCLVFRTDLQGDVSCKIELEGIRVSTQR